jgi:hypothetical protein
VLFVRPSKRLLIGAFSQNLFAAHVGITQLQPVVTYQLGHGWSLSAGDAQFTYDWERDEWTNLPLGFQIGVVRVVLKQPFRFYVNPQWNLKDITGAVKSKSRVRHHAACPSRMIHLVGSIDQGYGFDAGRGAADRPGTASRRVTPRGLERMPRNPRVAIRT